MDENNREILPNSITPQTLGKRIWQYSRYLLLFALTFFTTTLAGIQWLNRDPLELHNFSLGLPYSITLLIILGAHEFGHFFAARFHKVNTTYPFFIPIPPFLLNPFGTMGAVIRMRSRIPSKKALFDIGIAGPLAGLIVTICVLLFGYLTLPPKEYLFSIHPEYIGKIPLPETGLTFGNSFFLIVLSKLFSTSNFVPPMNEIYHYPFLCVGWFGLFVTALNLIPVGQLDGGHILYSLIGKKQGFVAKVFFAILLVVGLSGIVNALRGNTQSGMAGWLLWAVILFFIIKLDHPEISDDQQLDSKRVYLGWITFGIFILIFPPIPFTEVLTQ